MFESAILLETCVFLAVNPVNRSSRLIKLLYLQFCLAAHGIAENRFLYVNKLTKEKDGKIKKAVGHVLWPEVKIRLWYPWETAMDITRQALKDVSVCCLKTNTASFSLRQKHRAARRLGFRVGLCFISTLLVSSALLGLFPMSCTCMSSALRENSTLSFLKTFVCFGQ